MRSLRQLLVLLAILVSSSAVLQSQDLAIAKSHTDDFVRGETGEYTITVSNLSLLSSSSGEITVVDRLPDGLTYVDAEGQRWSCEGQGQTVTCTTSRVLRPIFRNQSTSSFTLTVEVALDAPAIVTNTATLSGGGDVTPENNTASDPTAIEPGPNPEPTVSSLNPDSAPAGSMGFTLTVNGSDFIEGSAVRWNGNAIPTTFVNATQLNATVSAALITSPGEATVTVFNPSPGGGESGGLEFTMLPAMDPEPSIDSLIPSSTTAGGADLTLTVSGTNFVDGAQVGFGGSTLPTTFVNSGRVTAAVPASLIAAAGVVQVSVTTPGGTSNEVPFTINNPLPEISTINPSSVVAGSAAFSLTVNGSRFLSSSIVRWNGNDLDTTFVNSGRLTALVPAELVSSAGNASVVVFTEAPGGGASNPATFAVNHPVPVLSSLSPESKSAGQADFVLTVTGSGFVPESEIHWNAELLTSTFVSSTELQGVVTAQLIAEPGMASVSVLNPEPGGGTSDILVFTIGDELLITTETPLPAGTLGQAYQQPLAAVGGQPPYRWRELAGRPLPHGLTLNTETGFIGGTPNEAGTYSFTVEILDALNVVAAKSFLLIINPVELLITTDSLPPAELGLPYEQTFAASGGTPPYLSWTVTVGQLPDGLVLGATSGVLLGVPTSTGTFEFTVTVIDNAAETASKPFSLIVPSTGGELIILTDSCPAAFIGIAYTCMLNTAGGVPVFTWSLAGGVLPPGLALDPAAGTISGTPTAAGAFEMEVLVTDSASATDRRNLTMTVWTESPVILGVAGAPGPASQNQVTLRLRQTFPDEVTGQVDLAFAADTAIGSSGVTIDDPAIQFSTGGRTAYFAVPAGSEQAGFDGGVLMLQTGTVAGTITLTVTGMRTRRSDILPSPAPTETVLIGRQVPSITDLQVINQTASSFTIEMVGFATTREITQAQFAFSAAPGQTLESNQVAVPLTGPAQSWYGSEASLQFGSQFVYQQPFNISGNTDAIASVTVTLSNGIGDSASAIERF